VSRWFWPAVSPMSRVLMGRGHRAWAFPCGCWLRGAWPGGSRTGWGPAALAVPEASLMRAARCPIMAAGERRAVGLRSVVLVRPLAGFPVAGSAAGCSHPFACSRPCVAGWHGAGSCQGRQAGSIKRGGRAAWAAGHDKQRPGAWRWPAPGHAAAGAAVA
jgi:hypothetical protein